MSVPASRLLPAVLREQLQKTGVTVLIGRVTAVPDRAHVTINVGEGNVTVPKLASYTAPVAGEPAFVLVDPLFTIALGSVSETPPPAIVDAATLDGIDSTGFMQIAERASFPRLFGIPAGLRLWGAGVDASSGPAGRTSIQHPFGAAPYLHVATPIFPSQAEIIGISSDASNVHLDWSTINVSVLAHVIALG